MEHETITRAILIGTNFYIRGSERQDTSFSDLKGCVEDVNQVEKLLHELFAPDKLSVIRLTATAPENGENEPKEPQSDWPTYENIIKAFTKVTEEAKPNDIVYIHYSGHGARVKTIFPDPEHREFDEALVPTNINSGGKYLRDREISLLIEKMVEKELLVTLILDSCHSGGANRSSENKTARGASSRDFNILDRDRYTISPKTELDSITWGKRSKDTKRGVKVGNHWSLEPRGYAFLAACGADEFASEATFNGKTQGLLTYNFINTIREYKSTKPTYYDLYHLVSAKVKEHDKQQTVALGGEADRLFLSSIRRELFYTVRVTKVHTEPNKQPSIELDAGSAQGISEEDEIDIWPSSCDGFNSSERVARFKVVDVEEFTLKADIVQWYKDCQHEQQLKPGFLGRPHHMPQKPVYFSSSTKLDIMQTAENQMDGLRGVFKKHKIPLSDTLSKAFFEVHTQDGNYVICGGGNQRLLNAIPPLPTNVDGAAEKLARNILHLTKYYNILELQNDESANSNEQVSTTLEKRTPASPTSVRVCEGSPADDLPSEEPWEVDTDGEVLLRVVNKSGEKKYIAVMDLDSDWCVEQIFPKGPGAIAEPLEPNQTLLLPLKLSVPDDIPPGHIIDTIKVITTSELTNFRWLEIPSLQDVDKGSRSQRARAASPKNKLEELQERLMTPALRKVKYVPINFSWGTTKLTVSKMVEKAAAVSPPGIKDAEGELE
ncbi:hypothetical protein AOL_s00097g120 [Orbilia oligospora ATCC 24927]|uniref:Peptidase C14 caspase domain-containing protein n=1 Tax=Arthrobotrys oligospora (strain ATCC 24927 / CBS 115.81 / DSM 1491) TaxID=756982 RepID=G1XIE3_ARTOA|nr:hypothetical protein AOL_s00097g120 [Orbilia oligospora ATCC 24927]EGX47074.1 hypothetical protein AOL_s00097g120 [Orbilia oligospora ATCC 24927]